MDELLGISFNNTVRARIAGAFHYYYLHVEGKNNIKDSILYAGVATEETALKYYTFLKEQQFIINKLAEKAGVVIVEAPESTTE